MSDHLDKHIARLKREKGGKWASEFEQEYLVFKLVAAIREAYEVCGLKWSEISKQTGVPEKTLKKITREDCEVALDDLKKVAGLLLQSMLPTLHKVSKQSPESISENLRAAVSARQAQQTFCST